MGKERKSARSLVASPDEIGTSIISHEQLKFHRKIPERKRSQKKSVHRRKPAFSPEYGGKYAVTRKGGRSEADRLHGRIVNALSRELSERGCEVANVGLDGGIRPDLVILSNSTLVFEVKAHDSWTDVFCGIGQCFVYSDLLGGHKTVRKVLVVPASINSDKIAVLGRLGIRVVKWREKGGGFTFTGLNRALPHKALQKA